MGVARSAGRGRRDDYRRRDSPALCQERGAQSFSGHHTSRGWVMSDPAALLPINQVLRAQHPLKRETFQTSRLLDFCSERELVKQIGHPVDQWPLVILKELLDNAIDAAEEVGSMPVIRVEVTDKAIVIFDNG